MKRLLLIICIFFHFYSYAQEKPFFSRVDIYIYQFYNVPFFLEQCDLNSNYIRVNALYKISILERNIIEDFRDICISNTTDSLSKDYIPNQFLCRVVVDFIVNEWMVQSVSFDNKGYYIKNDSPNYIYKPKKEMKTFLETIFPSFISFL